jgi:hypothetical protein
MVNRWHKKGSTVEQITMAGVESLEQEFAQLSMYRLHKGEEHEAMRWR